LATPALQLTYFTRTLADGQAIPCLTIFVSCVVFKLQLKYNRF